MLTLQSYSSPSWANAAKTAITAQVVFKEIGSAIPFTATQNDPEGYGVTVFDAIVAGAGSIPVGAYAAPTLTQQAAVAINAGLTLTLSGSLTLAATLFPTDATTQGKLADMAAMAARGVLPLGATTYPMKDAAGTWHQFNAAQYQAVAAAIAAYAAAIILIADGNPFGATALPSASVSLTV